MSAQHSKFGDNEGFSFSQMSSGVPCGQPVNESVSSEGNMSTPWSPSALLSSYDTSSKEVVQMNDFDMLMENSSDRYNSPKRKIARTANDYVPINSNTCSAEANAILPQSCSVPSEVEPSKDESVFIIEQILEDNEVKFLNNDSKFATALRESVFNEIGVVNVTKNYGRNVAIIRTKFVESEKMNELLNTNQLGTWKVTCRLPKSETVSVGKIGPISVGVTDEEILKEMNISNSNVIAAKRMLRRNREPTRMVRIEFSGVLPEYVVYAFQRYRVEKYNNEVQQCYNCQTYGHNAFQCLAKPRCVVCAGKHSSRDCPNKGQGEVKRCCNCGGAHTANYGGCPKFGQAKKVEQFRSDNKMSYRDAAAAVAANARVDNSREQRAAVPTGAVPKHTYSSHTTTVRQCRDACTQTEKAAVVESNEEQMIARVVNLVVGLMKQFSKDVAVDDSKVLEVVKSTTGYSLKNKKSKPPPGKPEERPPAPPQDTSGVRSLDDCSGPAEVAEARRERGDSWSDQENPSQWQTQGRGKGNTKAQDGKKN